MSGGLSTNDDDYYRGHVSSVGLDEIKERKVFVGFEVNNSRGKSVITKGKFNELNDQCGVRMAWRWTMVRKTSDT